MNGQSRPGYTWEWLLRATLAASGVIGVVVFIEPAPYEALWALLGPLALMTRNHIHVSLLPITIALLIFTFSGFVALLPHLHDTPAVIFQVVSLYLAVTFILFAIFFSHEDTSRLEMCLRGYAAGCFLASCYGLIGYFDIAGLADHATLYGRVRATFKDPNVFGSHMLPAATYLLAGILTARFKGNLLPAIAFGTIFCAVLLSMSRGSIAGMVLACLITGTACYMTGTPELRRRVGVTATVVLIVVGVGLVAILSVDEARELLAHRARLFQDYDIGGRGRFYNQAEAILLVPATPLGIGPQQFRKFYDIEPHSTYIGAFISYGWAAGFAWLAMTGSSIYVGVRLMVQPSPYRAYAHIIVPCVLVLFIQAFQIDVDHWRFFFFCIGALWGLEAARRRWQSRQEDPVSLPPPPKPATTRYSAATPAFARRVRSAR